MSMKIKILGMAALLAWLLLFCLQAAALAQTSESIDSFKDVPVPAADESTDTTLPHFGDARPFYVSGQINVIFQVHPGFHADYSGQNSFGPHYEKATSRIMTLYTGLRLNHSTEVLVDVEDAAGQGMSNSLGLAGYSNLDVVRIPGEGSPLSTAPYLARAMIHQRHQREIQNGGVNNQQQIIRVPPTIKEVRSGHQPRNPPARLLQGKEDRQDDQQKDQERPRVKKHTDYGVVSNCAWSARPP